MDNEQPRQELVKCVLVGDTAVGKTRLICARACNKHVSLSQLLSTHVPTVWAIDQYRIYKDVLERSWEVVDSVNVSLRLWDTFGDHEKDRRFAYGRADVVLLCFSITNPMSLRNCRTMWYEEIRRFCPQTPIILVGCKNDLRYMYRDETYLSNLGDRSPFIRIVRKSDLVMPDEARAVAKELGVSYYETSVFTYFGVNELFENAIRAALIARRQQRFWMTNLKRVQRPLLQAPFRPPKPPPPEVSVVTGTYMKDMQSMLKVQRYTDLILVVGTFQFMVHKFMLVAGSNAFHRLLTMEFSDMGARSSSESSIVSSTYGDSLPPDGSDDTDCLLKNSSYSNCNNDQSRPQLRIWDQIKRRSSYQTLPTVDSKSNSGAGVNSKRGEVGIRKPLPVDIYRELHHPIFQSIKVVHNPLMQAGEDNKHSMRFAIGDQRCSHAFVRHPLLSAPSQTIVTINNKVVTPAALEQCLKFIYCGSIDKDCLEIQEIRQAAEFLELPKLIYLLSNLKSDNSALSEETSLHYSACVRKNLERYCIKNGLFGDITFELDDGQMRAHRSILVERCDVMRAMLNGDFRESQSNIIVFPGVTEYTFHKLLCFIYTDEIPAIASEKCLNLLELANRMCLPRLLNLVEIRVVEHLTKLSQNETPDAAEQCLKLLEPVKLHNAHQLAEWCMSYLCVNFNAICKVSPKCLRALHPENQDYLVEHRWPPVWYLKDFDYYQRCLNDYQREQKDAKQRAAEESCFCFNGRRNQKPTQTSISAHSGEMTAARNGNSDGGGGGDAVRMFSSHGNSLNGIVIEEPDADLNF